MQINLFILDRLPDSLDEDVVAPRALAIHADRDLVGAQHAGECFAGELTALDALLSVKQPIASGRLLDFDV